VIAEITETLERVLGKSPELTHVVIDEVAMEDWGYRGVPTSQLRGPNPGTLWTRRPGHNRPGRRPYKPWLRVRGNDG
jgi:hypothetical protein